MHEVHIENKNSARICAGIVLYNPELHTLCENLNKITKQVDVVFLIDNMSGNVDEIEQLCHSFSNVFLKKNTHNVGFSKALNQLCNWAASEKYDWILTLNDDARCSDNMIDEFRKYISMKRIGIVCPRIFYEGTGFEQKCSDGKEWEFIDACMTSASLTSIKAWQDVGGFDEWTFIDCVDDDFSMRLKLHDYKIVRVQNTELHHRLGNAEEVRLPFGIRLLVTRYSSMRNYYFVRNNIYYIRKYRKHISVLGKTIRLLYAEIVKLIFEENRIGTLKSIFKGIYDGFCVRVVPSKGRFKK
jgi:rhamnosyltransferase